MTRTKKTSSRLTKEYNQKVYELSTHLLPALIATHPDLSETEVVDIAVSYARSLLVELGYDYYT